MLAEATRRNIVKEIITIVRQVFTTMASRTLDDDLPADSPPRSQRRPLVSSGLAAIGASESSTSAWRANLFVSSIRFGEVA